MQDNIEKPLSFFKNLKAQRHNEYDFIDFDEYSVIIRPKKCKTEQITLTLMGLTHGNETAGLAIINEIFRKIVCDQISLSFNVALYLGNIKLIGKEYDSVELTSIARLE